jgi:hypothetical protein
MRRVYLSACLLLVICLAAAIKLDGQGRSLIPGLHKGEQEIERGVDPPAFQAKRQLDGQALSRDAAELARLSSIVPGQIEELKAGKLHRDLADELKRIEKLARHLRSEVSP